MKRVLATVVLTIGLLTALWVFLDSEKVSAGGAISTSYMEWVIKWNHSYDDRYQQTVWSAFSNKPNSVYVHSYLVNAPDQHAKVIFGPEESNQVFLTGNNYGKYIGPTRIFLSNDASPVALDKIILDSTWQEGNGCGDRGPEFSARIETSDSVKSARVVVTNTTPLDFRLYFVPPNSYPGSQYVSLKRGEVYTHTSKVSESAQLLKTDVSVNCAALYWNLNGTNGSTPVPSVTPIVSPTPIGTITSTAVLSIPIETGWSVIGIPGNLAEAYTAKKLFEEFSQQGLETLLIGSWDKRGTWVLYGRSYSANDFTLEPYKGYFVLAVKGGTWYPRVKVSDDNSADLREEISRLKNQISSLQAELDSLRRVSGREHELLLSAWALGFSPYAFNTIANTLDLYLDNLSWQGNLDDSNRAILYPYYGYLIEALSYNWDSVYRRNVVTQKINWLEARYSDDKTKEMVKRLREHYQRKVEGK